MERQSVPEIQDGHSLFGKVPEAEAAASFNRLRREYKNGQLIFTSAILLGRHQNVKALRNLKLISMHCYA
jgi:hypothetical protein